MPENIVLNPIQDELYQENSFLPANESILSVQGHALSNNSKLSS